jgi:hypothetical protein
MAYLTRRWIAEPPNGWIKNVLGFRQISMRRLHRVLAGGNAIVRLTLDPAVTPSPVARARASAAR